MHVTAPTATQIMRKQEKLSKDYNNKICPYNYTTQTRMFYGNKLKTVLLGSAIFSWFVNFKKGKHKD